ncbi:MAG: UbiA family prenyltransferase [Parcubacteria group bacterium]|jgi:4-hydroxybenzoate polyprenyltransferase
MKRIMPKLEKMIQKIEECPSSLWILLSSFVSLILIRILIENWVTGENAHRSFFIFYEFFDSFLIAYLVSLWIIHKILKVSFKKAANILIWGYSVIIIPPLVDYVMSHGKGFWSFYTFDSLSGLIKRFFTFFGDRPDIGITYGVRAEILIAVLLILVYAYLKSKSILKSAFVSFLVYATLFILGTFPSWITIAVQGISIGFSKVTEIDAVQMFFSPFSLFSKDIYQVNDALIVKVNMIYLLIISAIILLGLFRYQKERFCSFLKNIRFPQVFYHGGLLIAGIGIGFAFSQKTVPINFFNALGFLVVLDAVILSWLASVVVNDIFDEKIDTKTNSYRPLIKKTFSLSEYKAMGLIFFAFSIYLASLVNLKISFLLIVYQGIAWTYSAWPMRLKRFAFVSTFVSSVASLMIFFAGYSLVTDSQIFLEIPFQIIILLIIAYTLSIPIKDFKDIEGDKGDEVYTVPVVFGEYWGKIIVASGILLSFLLSVILLNEFRLFWWAIILGGVSFWLVAKMRKSSSESLVNYRNIFWWILGTVSIYGIVLVRIVFL